MAEETLSFDARYGNVTFASHGWPTFEQVSNLARAAQLMGIPPQAVITSLRMTSRGSESEVDISWRIPE